MKLVRQAYAKRGINRSEELIERWKDGSQSRLFPLPHPSQQEEFAKLCLRLLNNKQNLRGSVIAVASSVSGEGASFVSYNLASALGLAYEQKVAWLDGNFRSPQRRLLDEDEKAITFAHLLQDPGLADELPCERSRITTIPGGNDLRDVRALFTDRNYSELLAALTSRFDFTIIDLPPVLESQDTSLMAKGTDGVLLVVAQRQLKYESIRSGVRSLQEVGVGLLGAVMNRREFDLPGFLHKWI